MSVFTIDNTSTSEEIRDFYDLYVESFSNLCIWRGNKIINLGEYLKPSKNTDIFNDDLDFIMRALGIIIYYTHNDYVITSISFVQIEEPTKCFVTIKYLCGNQITQSEKIGGKLQGIYLLEYIFTIYKDFVIIIEPATPALIPYYTNFKKPCFPYNDRDLNESFNFLIYGNLRTLKEVCFTKIFRSINIINKLNSTLQFESLNDLYLGTNNLSNLKDKLIVKLEHLVKTKEIDAQYYEQIMNNILNIKYYDINDILIESYQFDKKITHSSSSKFSVKSSGGKKTRNKRNKRNKRKTRTKRKNT
jgi:hypothetical protein